MKKIAIINLGTMEITLEIAELLPNKTFIMLESYKENTRILDDFEKDIPISQSRLNEVLNTLYNFKAISSSKNIEDVYCFAEYKYNNLKNAHSFFEQITSKTGYRFSFLSEKESIDLSYTAVVSSMDITKGVFLHIGEHLSFLCHYNRRMIIDQLVFPFGYASLIGEMKDMTGEQIETYIAKKVNDVFADESALWVNNVQQDTALVVQGRLVKLISSMARKKIDYKYNKDQNLCLKKEDIINACTIYNELPFDGTKKVKNTSFRADAMKVYANILKNIVLNLNFITDAKVVDKPLTNTLVDNTDELDDDEIVETESKKAVNQVLICEFDVSYGIMFKVVTDFVMPTRSNDVLDFSLSAIVAHYNSAGNSDYVAKLSAMIFKQLKVLHKLGRNYLTVLKIASKLYDAGVRINPECPNDFGYYALINSPIYGVQHREILLAGFVLMFQKEGTFELTEWAKYRRIIIKEGEDEADVKLACQRLAVILKMAKAFDRYSQSKVIDISCDNLGECVIMKTTLSSNSTLEIREAKKLDGEFKRVFNNRKIEIL